MNGPSSPRNGSQADLRQQMRRAVGCLGEKGVASRPWGSTSDLSIDEVLLLHSIGWEPVELVCGVSVTWVPYGTWTWGSGEIAAATAAQNNAFANAIAHIRSECGRAQGHGVVGMEVEVSVHPHHIDVEMTGTAVRPSDASRPSSHKYANRSPFVSDLSARDFALLMRAGWEPLGLASGASFVFAPRRRAGAVIGQAGQNVELANYTQALYAAREAAMERMQAAASSMGASGVVAVQVFEGPARHASHVVRFSAWGTAVRLASVEHQRIEPQVVLPLDDAVIEFAAESLR